MHSSCGYDPCVQENDRGYGHYHLINLYTRAIGREVQLLGPSSPFLHDLFTSKNIRSLMPSGQQCLY
uniref:Uncharacterized protein n=1 Tax=Nelumbo nucifera TaxID=4432 RepID=A0A822Z0M9_NELNU|nr:TPA_asm: hypothetical protein HUJ06_012854 [Nelumbo nucifera]